MLILLLLLFVGIILVWLHVKKQPDGFPPGPRMPLPLIGEAWVLGNDLTFGFRALADRHGDVVGLYLGSMRSVILNTQELIEEVMSREECSDRPIYDSLYQSRGSSSQDMGGPPGLLFANGPGWLEQRRFALKTLRNFGYGKTSMEELMGQELEDLCARLEREDGRYIQPRRLFHMSALRALGKILTNVHLDGASYGFGEVWKKMNEATDYINSPLVIVALQLPMMNRLLRWLGFDTWSKIMEDLSRISDKIIKEHEETYNDESLRDFTDAHLQMRYKNRDKPGSTFCGNEGYVNQIGTLLDLIVAGNDTFNNTLSWAVVLMALNRDDMKKVQEELDDIVGRSRLPCWADRASTPYAEAVIHEIQRCADVVPNGLPHATARETRIGGYVVPKGTQIFANFSMIHNNPKYFPDPDKFDPSRYITAEGKFEASPHVIPFGLGRRRCLGETLARVQLYRFFTGLVHRFDIEARPGVSRVAKREPGSILPPPQLEVKFVPRV